MDPILYTSIKDYNAAGPLPWLEGHTKEKKGVMLKIIMKGMEDGLSYQKISTNLNKEFPELKIKSPLPHATWFFTEIVLTEMRIRSELKKHEVAFEMVKCGKKVEKRWNSMPDTEVCESCRLNSAADWISMSDPFPSGHLYAPAHHACRCYMKTRIITPPPTSSGLPKDRWLVERDGDTVTVKRNPKYDIP